MEDQSNPDATEDELLEAWRTFTRQVESHDGADLSLAAPDRPVGMHMADEDDHSSDEGLAAQRSAEGGDDSDLDTILGGDSDLEGLSDSDLPNQTDPQASISDARLSRKDRKRQQKLQRNRPFHFKSSNSKDVVGVVFLEIDSAKDLPREKNLTKTGFDMDPFVITSFSKKTFRTRVIRHSLNPIFHDKLVLQVRKHEDQYSLKFTIVDRDKLSGNDYVGDCDLQIQDLIKSGPQADPQTGLYTLSTGGPITADESVTKKRLTGIRKLTRQMTGGSFASEKGTNSSNLTLEASQSHTSTGSSTVEPQATANTPEIIDAIRPYVLPLNLARKDFWGDKYSPELHVKAKFVPYPALRQQFWRVLLRHYDVDETGEISRVELTSMLDSLGAVLKESTIDSFFKRFAEGNTRPKDSVDIDLDGLATTSLDECLTIDQCVICLEDQLSRISNSGPRSSLYKSANGSPSSASQPTLQSTAQTSHSTVPLFAPQATYDDNDTSNSSSILTSNAARSGSTTSVPTDASRNSPLDHSLAEDEPLEEYLISLTQCPLCQKTNMDKKSDVDIVTHLATCASQDWRKVDHLVMGDFVTPSQAQRKWYTKIISKVGYGGYKLGANSANILVQDRRTGHIQEERMSVYVRLGIRLLYKGMKSSRMETGRTRKMLRSMSIKQGRKYDAPSSAKDIPGFIAFHQLNMQEVLDPVSSFKSFNEFFYRKLQPGARPCAQPEDPRIAVSPADCRSVVFNTINEATEIWVKGQNFSLQRLFGSAYPDEVTRFHGGSFGIFRLAPQDYHRFHIPVDGILGEARTIEGQYYTVNPMAIRSNLDVYGENVRVLVPIDTEVFGRVMIVCVGAMMVGSTVITAKEGSHVKRTDELGYFKFGGSTILLIFEPGKLVFDEDLTQNAKQSIETLLRVGSTIGHPPGIEDAPNESLEATTEADRQAASHRIAGATPAAGDDGSNSAAKMAKEAFSTHNAM